MICNALWNPNMTTNILHIHTFCSWWVVVRGGKQNQKRVPLGWDAFSWYGVSLLLPHELYVPVLHPWGYKYYILFPHVHSCSQFILVYTFPSKICFTFSLLLAVFFGSYIQNLTLGMVLWMYAIPLLHDMLQGSNISCVLLELFDCILACFCLFSSRLNLLIGSLQSFMYWWEMMSSVGMP